jgi:hypothetical protein
MKLVARQIGSPNEVWSPTRAGSVNLLAYPGTGTVSNHTASASIHAQTQQISYWLLHVTTYYAASSREGDAVVMRVETTPRSVPSHRGVRDHRLTVDSEAAASGWIAPHSQLLGLVE